MLGFVAQRLLYLVPVLLAVSLLTFLIASLLPGDLAYTILGDQATPEKVAALRHDMGLDQPIWWRYLSWLGNVLQGDFGRSFRTGQTVLQAVAERLPVSLELMVLAQLGALTIGIPLAIACAVRSGSAFDRFMTGSAFSMLSVPAFLSAILLIYLFAVELRWLPATGYIPFHDLLLGDFNIDHVVVGEHVRILAEQRALLGFLDVALDRHQTFLANLGEDLVQQRHELHVQRLGEFRTLEQGGQRLERCLAGLRVIADEKRAQRTAADHEQFERLEQRAEMPARERESAEDGDHDNHISDDY